MSNLTPQSKMKAILEYNLPEDEHEYMRALQGANVHSVLWKMDQYLRANVKHSPDTASKDTYNTYVECRKTLQSFISDYNVTLD